MAYLDSQIITYIGNKRKLLSLIEEAMSQLENVHSAIDLFSGSGIVARLFKSKGYEVIANDFEEYSKVINECYLSNSDEFDLDTWKEIYDKIMAYPPVEGVITKHYAPKDTENIQDDERAFYTHENAVKLDTWRKAIEDPAICPPEYKKFFLGPILYEMSVHTNTGGVFRAFYKKDGIGHFGGRTDASLDRIKGDITINPPVLSTVDTKYTVYNEDANVISKKISADLAYLDPPYNEHSYGANYFMFNVYLNELDEEEFAKKELPEGKKRATDNELTKVAGCPADWQRSDYYVKRTAKEALEDVVKSLDVKYILVSYSDEGHIEVNDLIETLGKYGEVSYYDAEHRTYGGCRNWEGRRATVNEYVFLLKKNKK